MIDFLKVRGVKSPERNEKENAGIDFFIPEKSSFSEEELNNIKKNGVCINQNQISIDPNCSVLIPSGIKSKFDNNLALIANNKSGIATKKGLIFGASVIDCSYQGEWHFHLINTTDRMQIIEFGQKIIQFIPHYINADPINVVEDITEDEFFTETTSRGNKGFGNGTGLK